MLIVPLASLINSSIFIHIIETSSLSVFFFSQIENDLKFTNDFPRSKSRKVFGFLLFQFQYALQCEKVKSSFRWSFQHVHKFSLIFIIHPTFIRQREVGRMKFQTYSFFSSSFFSPVLWNFGIVCLLRL